MGIESWYSSLVRRFTPDTPQSDLQIASQHEQNFYFAMECNGYFLENGTWVFNPNLTRSLATKFKGQNVSFFGPNSNSENFFSPKKLDHAKFIPVFDQPTVTKLIGKYRQLDQTQAIRIAFILGGMVRHFDQQDDDISVISSVVRYVARMTMLGQERSGEAVASAMAMYVLSGGSLEDDKYFAGHVYHMAEAIEQDPINPLETRDLGLSQVARLKSFMDQIQRNENQYFPDVTPYLEAFDQFPTVGAEFHFTPEVAKEHPVFWKRLAVLNMSQYQRDSYVQFSRNDRGVIEMRMNPSVYPITIANWNYLRLLFPELNQTFFTITLNRDIKTGGDFSWGEKQDRDLLNKLRNLGMLTYTAIFSRIPHTERSEEVNFGSIYLGQTVKMVDGNYQFTGNWSGGEGQNGQMAIYTGFGDNLPYLAYYLSMVLKDPILLSYPRSGSWSKVQTLSDALAIHPDQRKYVFDEIQYRIGRNERLIKTAESGNQIMQLLNP